MIGSRKERRKGMVSGYQINKATVKAGGIMRAGMTPVGKRSRQAEVPSPSP
ncbi:MAG: hypothetical protein HQ567_16790 [Candidatus Nealsonbacteria bacterium]|nr:hypothetical protein [Candidatus Nealsonbacteria bacterium]